MRDSGQILVNLWPVFLSKIYKNGKKMVFKVLRNCGENAELFSSAFLTFQKLREIWKKLLKYGASQGQYSRWGRKLWVGKRDGTLRYKFTSGWDPQMSPPTPPTTHTVLWPDGLAPIKQPLGKGTFGIRDCHTVPLPANFKLQLGKYVKHSPSPPAV